MTEAEFVSVVSDLRLPGGEPFPLPVVLDLDSDQSAMARRAESIELTYENVVVGSVFPTGVYTCDKPSVAEQVYGTADVRHPGVAHFLSMGDYFVGGQVRLDRRVSFEFSEHELTPEETRAHFARMGWRTVVGFQTRNVPHRAHEYLLRLALEQADGLFVQPLVGRKKTGDYTPAAILTAYRALIDGYLPRERVLLGVLSTAMRYAGPREALFHAIIRRNYGCTHFIIGRDHAGVGNYYGKYDAQELAAQFEDEIGIRIMRLAGPFYCDRCGEIVTERTCPHLEREPQAIRHVSGTDLRAMLLDGKSPAPELIRREVLESVRKVPIFIEGDSE